MEGRLWSKPSFVLSSYTGRLEQEDATGRFHAPSHRRYTGSRVFFAPWREDVFVTQRRKDAKVIRHRTARTVPLACEHMAWRLDERGMARQHRRYTSIHVFFAPLPLGVRMCLARKDATVIRHRTARAVPLLCRHQSRGIVANRSWGSDFSVHSVFSVVNTVVVDRHEPTPDGSRRAAFMRTQKTDPPADSPTP